MQNLRYIDSIKYLKNKEKISNQKYGDDSMTVLLSSFKPNGLCATSVNPPLACNDVLIIDDDVQGAPDLTVRLI